jgi:hypothetical protein
MTILKEMVYKLIAPVLRVWLRNSITGKPIKDTHKVLYYDRSQHLGFLFSRQIEYEKEFSAIIMQHMKPGNLVFEIGSNIGQYSLQIAERLVKMVSSFVSNLIQTTLPFIIQYH